MNMNTPHTDILETTRTVRKWLLAQNMMGTQSQHSVETIKKMEKTITLGNWRSTPGGGAGIAQLLAAVYGWTEAEIKHFNSVIPALAENLSLLRYTKEYRTDPMNHLVILDQTSSPLDWTIDEFGILVGLEIRTIRTFVAIHLKDQGLALCRGYYRNHLNQDQEHTLWFIDRSNVAELDNIKLPKSIEDLEAELGLPVLRGSEKQIDWARSNRHLYIKKILDYDPQQVGLITPGVLKILDAAKDRIRNERDSGYWIGLKSGGQSLSVQKVLGKQIELALRKMATRTLNILGLES